MLSIKPTRRETLRLVVDQLIDNLRNKRGELHQQKAAIDKACRDAESADVDRCYKAAVAANKTVIDKLEDAIKDVPGAKVSVYLGANRHDLRIGVNFDVELDPAVAKASSDEKMLDFAVARAGLPQLEEQIEKVDKQLRYLQQRDAADVFRLMFIQLPDTVEPHLAVIQEAMQQVVESKINEGKDV